LVVEEKTFWTAIFFGVHGLLGNAVTQKMALAFDEL